jgi:uncharacterized protein YecE (DUF72 family)
MPLFCRVARFAVAIPSGWSELHSQRLLTARSPRRLASDSLLPGPYATGFGILSRVDHPPILLGTSSFTATGWEGSFYPKGMRSADYLAFYAEHFQTVEVDSTFYACPSAPTVRNWASRTPAGFIFSVKVPQVITHEKVLRDCDADLKQFLDTMNTLGNKLGPIVFQFPFFNRSAFRDRNEFLDRLIPFMRKLPDAHKFAIEIRNRTWLDGELANLLRDHRIALVLQDRSWMPSPGELDFDPITTDWTYIRWLGDRKGIEEQTTTWDRTVVDRTAELSSWIDYCYQLRKRGVLIYAYANNHFSGHAPATIEQFRSLWDGKGLPEIERPQRARSESSLFPDMMRLL